VSSINKRTLYILITILFVVVIFIYKIFDPIEYDIFPKCPFLVLTGYQCAGCGSQRAIHALLNLNINEAWHQNALLVLSLPYILIGLIYNFIPQPTESMLYWRKILFGQKAIIVVMILIVCFWIGRNMYGFY
jgi:hypothetical protein